MDKLKKFQVLMLSLLVALLIITPLLSSPFRSTYLYFIFNLLIIALGAEAGLLSVFSKPPDDKRALNLAPKPIANPSASASSADTSPYKGGDDDNVAAVIAPENAEKSSEKKALTMEKSTSEKISSAGGGMKKKVAECPSMPSLFFIGGGDADAERDECEDNDNEAEEEEEFEEQVEGGISRQELFTKAENFIGNFYKQLKMQREESWKKIHGFYQKAF